MLPAAADGSDRVISCVTIENITSSEIEIVAERGEGAVSDSDTRRSCVSHPKQCRNVASSRGESRNVDQSSITSAEG